jgi:hypothetical protein
LPGRSSKKQNTLNTQGTKDLEGRIHEGKEKENAFHYETEEAAFSEDSRVSGLSVAVNGGGLRRVSSQPYPQPIPKW